MSKNTNGVDKCEDSALALLKDTNKVEIGKNQLAQDLENENDCLSSSARRCNMTPRKGCIYLILFSTTLSALIVCILTMVLNSTVDTERNKPSKALGSCAGSSDPKIIGQLIQRGTNMSYELLSKFNPDEWEFNRETLEGDKAFVHKKKADMYYLEGVIKKSPEDILKVVYDDFVNSGEWNQDIAFCQILKKLDKRTDISYQRTNSVGPVSSRDFIFLKSYRETSSGEHIFAFESIDWDEEGIQSNGEESVRAFMGVSGWVLKASDDDFDTTHYRYLADINIKMVWIPFRETFMISGLSNNINRLRQKLAEN